MSRILYHCILLFLLIFVGWDAYGQCPTVNTYTSGSNTIIIPSGVTSITVEAWGGGGRGGSWSGTGAGNQGKGGGGGGGAYSLSVLTVTPGETYTYVVGSGSNTASSGGNSRFYLTSSPGTDLVRAVGGNSSGDNSSLAGAGGSAASGVGTIKYSGGNGANGTSSYGGGGGSSSGTSLPGVTANNLNGATAPSGGGNGGNGRSGSRGAGSSPVSGPGGGGGGAFKDNNTNQPGGSGANGQITISYSLPANTAISAAPNQTQCINTALTPITFATTGATGIGAATGLPAGVTANWASNTITISGIPTTTGVFSYSIPMTGGCITGQSPATGTITVTPNNTVSAASSTPTLCINDPLTNITHTTTGATGIGAPTGLPAGVTAAWAGNTITISGTPTASGTFNYSIPLTGGCNNPAVNATGTITVTPNNTVSAASSAPTLCINEPLTNITHTTTGATGIGAPTGLPAGVTAAWAGNTITISGTPTASGTFNYSIPLTGGCNNPAVNATGTITVTPNNTVSAASSAPTLCINDPLTNITHTTTGATGIGAPTGLPAGVTAAWAGNTITISGTPTASGTFNYSIPLTGGCNNPAVNATGTITVSPNNTVSAASSAPTLCINDPLTNITHTTTGATGIGAPTGLPAGVTAAWAGNTITISGTPTASGTFNYSIPLTGGCNNPAVNATGTITVSPNNTVSAASSAPTLCINDPLTNITHTTTGATGIGAPTGLPAGVTAAWAGNTITISGTPTASGTFNYSIPLTGGCNNPAVNATGTIFVNPNASIDNFDINLCTGGSFSITPSNGTDGIIPAGTTYSWNPPAVTGGITGGASGTGANSISGTLVNPTGSSQTATYTVTPLSGTCAGMPFTITVTVDPITAITTQPDNTDRVECFGDGFNPLTVVAEGGDLSYQWYSVPTQTNSGGTAVSGATSDTFTPPSTTEGISFYYVVVTGNCGIETSTVSGEFRVNPPITVIDLDPSTSDETECLGDPFPTLSVLASGEGTVTYQWYRNTSDSNTGGTLISGANSEDYTPLSDEVGTYYYYAVASSNCGTVPSAVSGAFTVTPPTSIDSEELGGQTICDVDTFDPISVDAIGTGTLHYQWYSNTTASKTGPDVTAVGTDSDTFTPLTTAQGTTMYYFVEVSSACGTNVISNLSGAFTVSIDNTAAAPSSDPTVCINTTLPSVTIATTGATGIANDGDNSGVNGLPVGVSATWSGDIITISGTPSESGTFNYAIPLTGGCGIVEATGTITITPDNTAAAPSSSPTLCINTALTSITIGTTGATGISNDGDNTGVNGLPAGVSATWAGNTITISGTPTVSGTFNYSIPMTGGCGTVNATGTITVTPDNTAAAPSSSPTLCINSPLSAITIATTGATGIANDGDNTGVNGLPAGVSATWAGNTITITGTPTESGTFNYSIPMTGGCGTVNATGTIEVTPLATVSAPSVSFPSVCISSPTLTPFTQTTSGVTAIDQDGVPGVNGLPPGISATFSGNTITFSGTATTTGLYTYNIPLTGSCINGLTATGTIDVTPDYELTSVSSVSATVAGGSANITINGNLAKLPNGIYEVTYILDDGINPPAEYTSSSFSVSNGRGSFNSIPLDDEDVDVYTLTIKNIKKVTDVCTIDLDVNDPVNTTYFSVCGAPFNSNGTFYVPAGILEVTIQAFGAGASGESKLITIPVTPGEPLGVFVGQNNGSLVPNGRNTYVTRDSSLPDAVTSSLIYAAGGGGAGDNGQVLISYSCPDANSFDCIEVIDDGAVSGIAVIEFICDTDWDAPQGLTEFTVTSVGGGGGGGMGKAAGGGGAGGFAQTTVNVSNPYGLPASSTFDIIVGDGGSGATSTSMRGFNGDSSSVTGIVDGNPFILSAKGGGGGGSDNLPAGGSGASGGGGAFNGILTGADVVNNNGGSGSTGFNGGGSAKKTFTNDPTKGAAAGGGGGGAAYTLQKDLDGQAAGAGNAFGGEGGNGSSFTLGGITYYFGGGGGGNGFNFEGNSQMQSPGPGGEAPDGSLLGGNGSVTGSGTNGASRTGSGGGSGTGGGGYGGTGRVFITYPVFRILQVEYQSFEANFNDENRTGELNWRTSKEWENSHFEIERAVNTTNQWQKIGEVKGQGYSESPTEYAFIDQTLPTTGGNVFYRLKQVDYDESFSYSVTRSIQVPGLKGKTNWIIYPNPSENRTSVVVGLLNTAKYNDEPIIIRISDVRGVVQTYTAATLEEVNTAVNSYLENAISGIYIVQFIWGDHSEQIKIVRK